MKAVITCDIIKSRQYSNLDRDEINRLIKTSFNDCCNLIPEANADKLSFSVIQGDEFQFLINKPEYAYQFVVFYRLILSQSELKPAFRAGIGIGDVSITDADSYKMDGPAFHRSRDALNKFTLKKHRNRNTFIISENNDITDQLDTITFYNDFIEQKWTVKQKEAIYLYKEHLSFEKAALKVDVTHQALQQRIDSSGWKQMNFGFNIYSKLVISRLQP